MPLKETSLEALQYLFEALLLKFGADCLFQIISQRYERGSTLITTNRIYKQWGGIFNNDSVLTSALLDRLLLHAETVLLEGKRYRSKGQVEV